jgi:DNA-binding NtrC family response regulator
MFQETILIFEEDLQLRWILKTYLENKGFTIIAFDTIEQVLEAISKEKVSVFITEYWVNYSATLETIKKFRKMLPEVYIMLLTHRIMDEREYEDLFQAGVDDLFEKPFSLRKMLVLLNKRLNVLSCLPAKINVSQNEQKIARMGKT